MTSLDRLVNEVRPGQSLDESHVCCCRDENVGLCGADLSRHPFSEEETTCHVCSDLDAVDGTVCPVFGRCPA